MRVQTTIHIDDLTGNVCALIRSQVYAHMSDILRTSIAIDTDIAQEDILQSLRYISSILRGNDQTGTYTVTADVLLTVLQCSGLSEHINAGLCAGISSRSKSPPQEAIEPILMIEPPCSSFVI